MAEIPGECITLNFSPRGLEEYTILPPPLGGVVKLFLAPDGSVVRN